jgi:hypothetical protein
MEVHPPHNPIHTWKDFLIHLLAITVGLLIALGLEAIVEAAHHHRQVVEARSALDNEIAANRSELQAEMKRMVQQQQTLEQMKATVQTPHPSPASGTSLNISVAALRRSAFDTAITSGALALMENAEASEYAEIYQTQTIYNSVQDRAVMQTEMSLISALPGPGNTLEGVENLSSGELASLKEKINEYRTQLTVCIAAGKELDGEYGKRLHQ